MLNGTVKQELFQSQTSNKHFTHWRDNMKKLLTMLVSTAVIVSSVPCFGAGIESVTSEDISGNENNKRITVSGTAVPDTDISFRVYKKGKTKEDIKNEPLNNVLYYGKQGKSDESGKFFFEFNLIGGEGTEGAYSMEINYKEANPEDTLTYTYAFLPKLKADQFVAELNQMHKTVTETVSDDELDAFIAPIGDFVTKQYLVMPHVYSELSDAEKREVFGIMIYDDAYSDVTDVPKAFEKAEILRKSNNAEKIDDLIKEDADFVKAIGLNDTEALAVYLDDTYTFDRAEAAQTLANIKNAKVSKENFENKVITLAVGAQTKYTVIDILEALNSYIGLDFSKYDENTSKQDSFKDYLSTQISLAPTINEIKTAFANTIKNVINKPTNTSGSTSSSSSSKGPSSSSKGSSSASTGVSMPVTTDVKKPEFVKTAAFKDLDTVLWAKDAITKLYEKGCINGMSDDTFAPKSYVKREEYLKMLISVAGIDISDSTTEFSDVVSGAWYEKYVATGLQKGIVSGIDKNMFGIGNNITRQDMAVMMYRILKMNADFTVPDKASAGFKDEDSIDEYAKEAVDVMQKLGIINGMGDERFCPKENATRAQAAVCIYKMLDYIQ